MPNIIIEIDNCKHCPCFETKNQYSSDGWDRMEDWVCSVNKRTIQSAVEWYEEKKIKIPDWCPKIVIEDKLER